MSRRRNQRRRSRSRSWRPARSSAVALRSLMLTGLFLLVLFHTLRVARDLFLPLMLAFFLASS